MLTDAALKNLNPKDKAYKVADRDGMYVRVNTNGTISFRYDYRLNGRRETVTFGKYGPAGLSLARAREICIDARRMIQDGLSPAIEKQRAKRRIKEAKSFGEFGEIWMNYAPMADSTRAMRRSTFERDLLPTWRNRLLTEITHGELRALCKSIVDRGALLSGLKTFILQYRSHEEIKLGEVAGDMIQPKPCTNRGLAWTSWRCPTGRFGR